MQKSQVVNLVKNYLGFHENLEEQIILDHMDLVQEELEAEGSEFPIPMFLFNHTYTDVTVAGTASVNLPENFIRFDDDFAITCTTSEGIVSLVERKAQYQSLTESPVQGKPCLFYPVEGQIILAPVPDAVYTIAIPHYASSEALSSAETSKWFTVFPKLIIAKTVASIAMASRDTDAISFGLRMADAEMDRYLKRVETERHILRSYVMGGDL